MTTWTDRSSDFALEVKHAYALLLDSEKETINHPKNPLQSSKNPKIAMMISQDLIEIQKILYELRRLAGQKGLFSDPREEIEELSSLIKGNMKDISSRLGTFQKHSSSSSVRAVE